MLASVCESDGDFEKNVQDLSKASGPIVRSNVPKLRRSAFYSGLENTYAIRRMDLRAVPIRLFLRMTSDLAWLRQIRPRRP